MKITMAHGSGGKSSEELMEQVFGRHFANPILDKMEDAAVLEVSGRIAFSTDTFVVNPLEFKGGNIGKLAICGTVNDLLMMGAQPKYLTCGFVLEEGLEVELLERVVATMADYARQAGVLIVAGDTKVVEGQGGLFINTSGIGIIEEGTHISAANCRPGDAILLSGTLGDHHGAILSARMGMENGIHSDCALLSDLTDALRKEGISVRAMRDVTRGGLGTILNEIAGKSRCQFEIEETVIPMKEEVAAFCDILGLEPLYMANEGKMVLFVPEEEAEKALAILRDTKNGKEAAIIGRVREGSGVRMITRLGGSRLIDVLYGEGLPRIC